MALDIRADVQNSGFDDHGGFHDDSVTSQILSWDVKLLLH